MATRHFRPGNAVGTTCPDRRSDRRSASHCASGGVRELADVMGGHLGRTGLEDSHDCLGRTGPHGDGEPGAGRGALSRPYRHSGRAAVNTVAEAQVSLMTHDETAPVVPVASVEVQGTQLPRPAQLAGQGVPTGIRTCCSWPPARTTSGRHMGASTWYPPANTSQAWSSRHTGTRSRVPTWPELPQPIQAWPAVAGVSCSSNSASERTSSPCLAKSRPGSS